MGKYKGREVRKLDPPKQMCNKIGNDATLFAQLEKGKAARFEKSKPESDVQQKERYSNVDSANWSNCSANLW